MILGLSGRIGAGKDTLANYLAVAVPLVSNPAPRVVRVGLADAIKEILIHAFCVPREHAYGSQADKRRPMPTNSRLTIRDGAKIVGQAFARVEEGVWIRRVAETIELHERHTPDPILFVVPDVRFPREADWIKAQGGRVIRLTRFIEWDTHESECALDDYTFSAVVDNDDITPSEVGTRVLALLVKWGFINAALL